MRATAVRGRAGGLSLAETRTPPLNYLAPPGPPEKGWSGRIRLTPAARERIASVAGSVEVRRGRHTIFSQNWPAKPRRRWTAWQRPGFCDIHCPGL